MDDRKIQKLISLPPSRIKHPKVFISLCLPLVGKIFYEKLRIKTKTFVPMIFYFWWQHWNTVCNMTGEFKTLVLSPGEKWIWIIFSSQTVKYYCEMNIYYVIVKFTTSVAVNSVFKCKENNLAKANEVIF